MADPVPPTDPKRKYLEYLIQVGLMFLAAFLAAKWGITLPAPPPVAPQPQITVLSFGQPATASPVVPAAAAK